MHDPDAAIKVAPARIELRNELDCAYWCRVFDVTHAELRQAIQQVGPGVAAVRRYLGTRTPPPRVDDSGF